jgi:hypothetical protein
MVEHLELRHRHAMRHHLLEPVGGELVDDADLVENLKRQWLRCLG